MNSTEERTRPSHGPVHYEMDQYVSPEYTDETVNLGCVHTERMSRGPDGRRSLQIDFLNGWSFVFNDTGECERTFALIRSVQQTLERAVNRRTVGGFDLNRMLSDPQYRNTVLMHASEKQKQAIFQRCQSIERDLA